MKLQYFTVDAFTSEPFTGNPAAVCPLEEDVSDSLKQSIAKEMNISETCFITKESDTNFETGEIFGLRWFTPTNEVPLCGHATLAAATVLFRECKNNREIIKFQTLSGILEAKRRDDKVVLDLPVNAPEVVSAGRFDHLVNIAACGLPVQEVAISNTTKKLLVRLKDSVTQSELESIRPDTAGLMASDTSGQVMGVIVTLAGGGSSKYHFMSRYFAPWNGIPEDPVTGSAHTVLAPYWRSVLGRDSMIARQCSSRGGDLYLEVLGNGRIEVAGESVIVMEGFIRI